MTDSVQESSEWEKALIQMKEAQDLFESAAKTLSNAFAQRFIRDAVPVSASTLLEAVCKAQREALKGTFLLENTREKLFALNTMGG